MKGRMLRLFVAIYPPDDARREMLQMLRSLSLEARYRATPADQVHMTVQFIGEVPERDLEEVSESVRRSASGIGPFSLVPTRLLTLPERGPVRLVAMETDAPAGLLELHRRLAMRLARSPRAKAGDRFLPHLTLGRFSGETRAPKIDQAVSMPAFQVTAVALMRSILRAEGAEHVLVEEVGL